LVQILVLSFDSELLMYTSAKFYKMKVRDTLCYKNKKRTIHMHIS